MHSSITVLALVLASSVAGQTIAGKCTGGSCYIAELSTSTNTPYKLKNGKKPPGGSAAGDKCIKSYYTKLGLPAPEGLKRFTRGSAGDNLEFPQDEEDSVAEYLKEKRALLARGEAAPAASCKKNTMIYARGTTEAGQLGSTVGPALQRALGTSWDMIAIGAKEGYKADMPGIYCIGMPGGWVGKGVVEAKVAECPNTNIVLSGYSQGAMVVRLAAAWVSASTRKHIKGIILYGDPFNGATVKGIATSRVKTFCNDNDGVCKGALSIGVGHLTYAAGAQIKQGVDFANKIVAQADAPAAAAEEEE